MASLTFSVRAETSFGDKIVLVGGGEALGHWDPKNSSLELITTEKDYPLWKSKPVSFGAAAASGPLAEYKYVRLTVDGQVKWEFDGDNRQIPEDFLNGVSMVVDDGRFGCLTSEMCAFPETFLARDDRGAGFSIKPAEKGLSMVVLGDEVAAGHGAAGYDGWAAQLGRLLSKKYGYGYSNVSRLGLCALEASKQGLAALLPEPRPDVVVLAFSLELQWLATCPDWDRGNIYENNIKALVCLVAQAWELGVMPVVAGLCPNGAFEEEHGKLLRDADAAMKRLGAPVLDWLHTLTKGGDSYGTWMEKFGHGTLHPNTSGHAQMLSVVDTDIFEPSKVRELLAKRADDFKQATERVCFSDRRGFEIKYCYAREELIVSNTTTDKYDINPGWGDLQNSLQTAARAAPWILKRGLYVQISKDAPKGALLSACIGEGGALESEGPVPPGSVTLRHVGSGLENLPEGSKKLFFDGKLGVVRTADDCLQILNDATCEYNVHPMWYDVRQATKVMAHGVYEDDSGLPFRTAIISCHGLQSRVKIPPKSAIQLRRVGDLSSIKQVAVLPLGDRCSIRMLLHKIEYDGPCYPFDLTRTTSLADVADMVATGFSDMWNPEHLYYEDEAGRVFHRKWGGLSFAHEVEYEQGEDPINNFAPVAQRMAKRYTGRAARFDWACTHADSVMFIRTGVASRGEVCDLLSRMQDRYPGLQASLLLISDQDSSEFDDLEHVQHVRESFDPDRMYEDMNYWMNCASRFRGILEGVGINARSLYWCPNNLKQAKEELESAAPELSDKANSPKLTSEVAKFSHANLYELHQAGMKTAAGA